MYICTITLAYTQTYTNHVSHVHPHMYIQILTQMCTTHTHVHPCTHMYTHNQYNTNMHTCKHTFNVHISTCVGLLYSLPWIHMYVLYTPFTHPQPHICTCAVCRHVYTAYPCMYTHPHARICIHALYTCVHTPKEHSHTSHTHMIICPAKTS